MSEDRSSTATVETITATEIAYACGFALDSEACPKCGGCGWFTTAGPNRPCECNPHRKSVDMMLAELRIRRNTR